MRSVTVSTAGGLHALLVRAPAGALHALLVRAPAGVLARALASALALALAVLGGCGDDPATGDPDAAVTVDASDPGCDPGVGWRPAAALPLGATQETATVAVDGKIYVIGGFNGALGVLDEVQVFDTSTCAWSAGPELPLAVHHANAAVVDGTIYVVGAMETINFRAVGHTWSWNPATESAWTTRAAMPAGTERGSSIVGVIGPRIYLAGGLRGGAVAEVSAFDTSTGQWDTALPPLPAARDHGCGGVVDGRLYVTGGRRGTTGSVEGDVWEYTPGGAWVARAAMPTARGGTACGVLGDRIVVVGGEGNPALPSGVFAEVEAYTPATDTWQTLAPMTTPRHGMGAAAWDGRLYVPGGATREGFGAVAVHEIFTPGP